MKIVAYFVIFLGCVSGIAMAEIPISNATKECVDCHSSFHPGIVEDWKNSRHTLFSPGTSMKNKGAARKISAVSVPNNLANTAVGCAECHTLNAESHADTFNHNGYKVHVVVTPKDCSTCHTEESAQFEQNLMSRAYGNLASNNVYQDLQRGVLGEMVRKDNKILYYPPNESTAGESCYYCHGTKIEVKGLQKRETLVGTMEFPKLSGWPNGGVGRINPDGSKGSCSACHTRHSFSIEMARKPHTCKECHTGPDVPSYKVYSASKHGTIYDTMNSEWDFRTVPWTIGKDFAAPTCAACHVSLLTNPEGDVVAKRTHRMNDRLSWRIFGLFYAHPRPKSPDTSIIRNKDGLPLPTDFDGGFASEFLITENEQKARAQTMQAICLSCHAKAWVDGHRQRYENTIRQSNASIAVATGMMNDIWKKGFAKGIRQGESMFDEAIERKWCDTWLFYGNTIRFASAMSGGGDYGVFADGRYQLTQSIAEMQDWLNLRLQLFSGREAVNDNGKFKLQSAK